MAKNNQGGQAAEPGSRRQQLRAEQERAAKEARVRKIVSYVALGVAGLAVIGGIVWGVVTAASVAPKPAATSTAGVNTQYTVSFGTGPRVVDVYQDYICPACGQFERANAEDLISLVSSGQITLRIHPMNFLDAASLGTKYSSRAANAFVTVAKAEPDKALAFNEQLYLNQPAEKTTGLTDAQIAELAKAAGVSQATIATFAAGTYNDFVTNSNAAAFSDNIGSTPTILIDGVEFTGNVYVKGQLRTAITAAQ